jgi:hypothetical protein
MKNMKKLILTAIILSSAFTFAQDKKEGTKEGWTKKGNFSFLLNQSAFDNWTAGGINNVAGNLSLNYDFNYVKGDIVWDNKFIAAYGVTKIKGANQQKTDDRLEFNSLVGKKTKGFWYYSAFLNFKTQMDSGFDTATGVKTTHFFSPAYLQVGPGMLWKKSDNLKVNIAPATSRLILVDGRFTEFGESFGVGQGKTSRFEFGASIGAYYKLTLMENVSMENILNLYTNYLENPQNVDLDYTMNLVMSINKYLSANLSFQTIYDDNAFKGFQTREVFGVGFNYGF